MATIVREGRDPWWAPLAVNVLGGLFNDWQQREKNKKEAAYLGELAKIYNGMQDGQNDTAPAPAQDTGQGLLNTNMAVPDGYNSDGWANAFHKTDTPLTQFDLGTTGLASIAPSTAATTAPLNAWANALGNSGIAPATTQPARAPIMTPMDFYRAALELAGTKRFRMLNPDRVQAMLTPYMKMNEEARQEQLRNAAAEDYLSQTSGAGRINSVMGNVMRGITPESLGNTVFNQNKPTISTADTGGQILFNNIDPMTGMPVNTWTVDRTLTPQQQLDHQFRMLQHEAQQAQFREQMNYNHEGRAWEQGYKDRQLAVENNQVTGTPFTGNDGYQYIMTRNGKTIKITDVPGLTPAQEKTIRIYEDSIKNIAKDRERLRIDRNVYINKGLADDPRVKEIENQLTELDKQEKQYQNKIYETLQSVSTGQQGTLTQTGQPTEQFLPPVAPPVNRYISQQEYDSYLREAEKGTLTAKGTPIKNRQELDDYLRNKGVAVLGNSRTTTPVILQTESPDIAQPNLQTVSPDITQLGRNDAVSNTEVLASDTNTEAGIQNALEELNGQFGEQRWADWVMKLLRKI